MSDTGSESDSLLEQDEQQQDWEEWTGSDAGEDATRSLFDGSEHPSPAAAIQHDAQQHGFDILAYKRQVRGWRLASNSGVSQPVSSAADWLQHATHAHRPHV